ncbi:MAG TPA: tetratricopeptide repeat protein [Caldimonas sp.]|nr:tetratricopeptide repeat protein [Caldimonas sp.]
MPFAGYGTHGGACLTSAICAGASAVIKRGIVSMMVSAAALFSLGAKAGVPEDPGMRMVAKENYGGARAYFQGLLKGDPRDAAAAAGMATLELTRGNNESSVEWARKAIELAPTNAAYRMLLGVAYGQYVRDVNPLSQLGIAYKVRDSFEQAVQLAPDSAEAHAGLAKYYILAPGIAGGSTRKAEEQLAALDRLDAAQAAAVRATLAQQHKDLAKTED